MSHVVRSGVTSLSLVFAFASACGSQAEPPKKKADAVASAKKPADKKPAVRKPADKGPEEKPADPAPAEPSPAGGSGVEPPAFISKALIEHTKVVRDDRSEVRRDGTYAGMLVVQLPPKQTADGCISTLQEKLKPHLADIGEVTSTPEGDKEFRGDSPEYHVTCMCGKDKDGVLSAAIGYSTK